MSKNIAIFASGGGSNAEVIIKHFKQSKKGNVALIVTNNENAGIVSRAENHNIPFYILEKSELEETEFSEVLMAMEIDFIVLAGFLKKIPEDIIEAYPSTIVNIHPALLPKYGGKGMYGLHVHQAVAAAKESESGMTIHYVNGKYDDGAIIEQHKIKLDGSESAKEIASKVLELEHDYYALCIDKLL
ncbi:MAG: phosphoribosylglycinamide formyltransferase [Crocinitomicaceae bacterium]